MKEVTFTLDSPAGPDGGTGAVLRVMFDSGPEGGMVGERYLLLVEDNPDDIYLTLRELRRSEPDLSVEVVTEAGLVEGFLAEAEELPEAVLLGLRLVHQAGLDLLRSLRINDRTSKLPVVVLASGQEERERVGPVVRSAGRAECLIKPVYRNTLEPVLSHLGVSSPGLAAT